MSTTFLACAGFHLRYAELRKALLLGELIWFINGLVCHLSLAVAVAGASVGINLYMLLHHK